MNLNQIKIVYFITCINRGKLFYRLSNYYCWFIQKDKKREFLNLVNEKASDEYLLYLRIIEI